MLVIDESTANRPDLQGAYFDGSLELLRELAVTIDLPSVGLTRDARQALLQYDWPGNLRELRNVLERAAILSEGALIDTSRHARSFTWEFENTDSRTRPAREREAVPCMEVMSCANPIE
jgi:DNA-binding NtrC family response regulator